MEINTQLASKYNVAEEVISYIRSAYKNLGLSKSGLLIRQGEKIAAIEIHIKQVELHPSLPKHKYCKEFECFKLHKELLEKYKTARHKRLYKAAFLDSISEEEYEDITKDVKPRNKENDGGDL